MKFYVGLVKQILGLIDEAYLGRLENLHEYNWTPISLDSLKISQNDIDHLVDQDILRDSGENLYWLSHKFLNSLEYKNLL